MMRDGFAPAGDEWIFYRESRRGESPVVFIHAGVADSRMWLGQLDAVPDGHRFVAYDQRGFGSSEVGKREYRNHEDALALMDYLSLDAATLVGCSIGAGIALDVAISNPDRVRALVLVGGDSPGFMPEDRYESPEWPAVIEAYKAGDYARAAELESAIWLVGHGREGHAPDPATLDLFVEMDIRAMETESGRDALVLEGPDRAAVDEIDTPTFVIVGEHDLPDLREHAAHLAARLSDRDHIVIPDTAHLPALERPDAFNRVLFGLLDGL